MKKDILECDARKILSFLLQRDINVDYTLVCSPLIDKDILKFPLVDWKRADKLKEVECIMGEKRIFFKFPEINFDIILLWNYTMRKLGTTKKDWTDAINVTYFGDYGKYIREYGGLNYIYGMWADQSGDSTPS